MTTIRARRRNLESASRGGRESKPGEPLEITLKRAMESGQPIRGGITPPLYTEEGSPGLERTDIRTDRFEEAKKLTDSFYNRKSKKTSESLAEMGDMAKAEGAGGSERESNGTT